MDDDHDEQDAPCFFCWELGWADSPCPGHRLLVRRELCEQAR